MSNDGEQKFLSPGQAARRLSVSRATVSRALLSGELPGIRDNSGRWKIKQSDLSQWRDKPDTAHRSAHDHLMITDHEQVNQALLEQISTLREQLHAAELRHVRLEAASAADAQAYERNIQLFEQRIAELKVNCDRWHELATRPAPTFFERIRDVFSSKTRGA